MKLSRLLKATERSLKITAVRAAVRIGSQLAPQRTAEFVARRFFVTDKRAAPRAADCSGPVSEKLQAPDGQIATYRWGDVQRSPTVVLVHGWNGRAQQMEHFAAPLRQLGFAVLAFDHIGHGASSGDRSSLPVIIRTVDHVLKGVPDPAGVIAHSIGGAAVASVLASSRSKLSAAVLIAPPSDPRPFLMNLARMLGAPETLLLSIQQAAERMAGVEFKRLVADPWNVRRIRTPLFVIHDVGDEEVPISNGYAYTLDSRTRLLATDGLGHRRILRDLHVVEEATKFIALRQPVPGEQRTLIAA